MDLNGPGTSLFQGNDLNNFDNLAQREEEDEAIEEQKRRDLELKSMLENAFDDVSFDNDEGSACNESQNHSTSGQSILKNNSFPDLEFKNFKETSSSMLMSPSSRVDSCNDSIKHKPTTKEVNKLDFNNESESYPDQYRKNIMNGSFQDVVDASGGGKKSDHSTQHYDHCFQKSLLDEINCNGASCNVSNMEVHLMENAQESSEQLKILYDIRVREVHRLTELVDSIRNQHEVESKDLKHQIRLLLAEKERIILSQSQLQNLVINGKVQIESLINKVQELEKVNKELETSKNELILEFDSAKLTIDDLQRKILVLEKNSKCKSEAIQYETHIKSIIEKHNNELMTLRKELESYIQNYETLCKENEDLKLKISNLNQINDETITKKSEIINRLSQQIEAMQKQYESLMKKTAVEDNIRLQAEIKILKEEKAGLNLKIETLEKENFKREEELKQYESLCRCSLLIGDISDTGDIEGLEVNGKLGAELYKALNAQKAKRQEIKNLQNQLDSKNEQISLMSENEKVLTCEIINYKEEVEKHLSEIKNLKNLILLKEEETKKLESMTEKFKNDLNNCESNYQSKIEVIQKEKECLKTKISDLEKEKREAISKFHERIECRDEDIERVREEAEKHFKLEILKRDLEIDSLKKEVEDLKNLYVEVYNAKENLVVHMEKEKDYSGKKETVDVEEVKRLQKELEKSRHRILDLDQKLKQQYQQEVEILNLEISQLNLQIEKIKKEKDRELGEKGKICMENELLKLEIEDLISEKNLLFLNNRKLETEIKDLKIVLEKAKENLKNEANDLLEKQLEITNFSDLNELAIKKLKKGLECNLQRGVKSESKSTSPVKPGWIEVRNVSVQGIASYVDKSISPMRGMFTQESSTSPLPNLNNPRKSESTETRIFEDVGVSTEPKPVTIPKKEVIEIMEKLGAHHEEEIRFLEGKYRMELAKLDKKFQAEVDKAKEIIRNELEKQHISELEEIKEKHKIELKNRIEQEKKEAVVELITEWACEVQSLKTSYAESQAEIERMKIKYKAAKSAALQYKTYFKSKAEHMKEEWKRIEDGYERALKELEKNVHILVDVKEDEVKAKVNSLTKIYEQKINKMRQKLSKCEDRLKYEKTAIPKKEKEALIIRDHIDLQKGIASLSIPERRLFQKKKTYDSLQKNENMEIVETFSSGLCKSASPEKRREHSKKDESSDKERTSR